MRSTFFKAFRVFSSVFLFFASSILLADDVIHFNRDIRPLLSDKCFACHGLDKNFRKADLRLDQRLAAIDKKAIVPGYPDQSSLIERIFSSDGDVIMPPARANKALTASEKELLRKWIEQGAEYHPHWAFVSLPKIVQIPQTNDLNQWVRTPVDAFVLERLVQEQLEPAVEATRERWLRRASFDLTGLPPSLDDLDAFLRDTSPKAYELAVDRLLQLPAFGERMASEWLDVARYADTFGYQSDREMHVWPWRDWVIRAFNDNLPYDQFILWQTAGDLLPNPTRDQLLATTFNRLHRQTNEGGSVEEEFRQAYIADRVVTNGTAFLGMTFECARCHDHKYDPISQADFYRFAAFFSNIDEHGLYSHFTETAPTPAMPLYEDNQQVLHQQLLEKIAGKEQELELILEAAHTRFAADSFPKNEFADGITVSDGLTPANATLHVPKLYLNFNEAAVSGGNQLVSGVSGQAIRFGGDDAVTCPGAGQYGRPSTFTIACWLKPAEHKPRVVVLHQSVAAEDAAYRGYSLVLDQGHLQFSLVHFWPGNAIQIQSKAVIPVDEWSHVAVTYDGSSRATGVRIFINGNPTEVRISRDNLTRDILYRKEWGDSNSAGVELSLGARFRDIGFRGGVIDELCVFDRGLSSLDIRRLYLAQVPRELDANTRKLCATESELFEDYLKNRDESYQAVCRELFELRTAENELITRIRQIMVMSESSEIRPVFVLKRGAYDSPGEQVTPDTPVNILPFSNKYPRNRLGLGLWLVDEENPLTSRVAVNRIWSIFFGRGLVSSVGDFGGQGQLPSHPELLDWLARDFVNSGWNFKQTCKQIVLSSTYRQSSVPRNVRTYQEDPENRLLARGPRYRLPAEQLRDHALFVSGLLVAKLGGPSVMPYQPSGLWEESGTNQTYHQSKGEGLYRRSLYTFWRRTSPPPSMLAFDATSREVCTARRERTATPLQALVLLNDPQFIEAARGLAERLLRLPLEDRDARLCSGFRHLTSRNPTIKELDVLSRLYEEQKQHFETIPNDATAFLAIGESPRQESFVPSELAAMTVVMHTVMSYDECVTKR